MPCADPADGLPGGRVVVAADLLSSARERKGTALARTAVVCLA
jgi:hypothetical protein